MSTKYKITRHEQDESGCLVAAIACVLNLPADRDEWFRCDLDVSDAHWIGEMQYWLARRGLVAVIVACEKKRLVQIIRGVNSPFAPILLCITEGDDHAVVGDEKAEIIYDPNAENRREDLQVEGMILITPIPGFRAGGEEEEAR